MGLSIAYWLTEMKPELNIVVLEKNICGSGASGRNAGFLTLGSASFYKSLKGDWGTEKAKSILGFAAESLRLVHEHILQKTTDIKFTPTSSLTLFQSEEQLTSWKSGQFSPESFHFNWLSQKQMPKSLQSNFFGGYESGPEYKVNPSELLTALKNTILKRKVRVVEYCSAFEISAEGVKTELNTIRAVKVVLALNAYLGQFHDTFKDLIKPKRAQMLAVELEDNFDCPGLYYDPPHRVYWRKTENNVLIIGGKRLLDENGEIGEFEKVSAVVQRGLEDYVKNQLGLRYKVLNRWSGTMGFTSHELPLSGLVKAPVETYMVGGFSGHGMGLGFRTALDMAEMIFGKKESFFNQFKKAEFSL